MSSTTSRWISRSWSNASASWVKLTVPSMEFSIGDEAEIDLAGVDGVEHVGHRAERHELGSGQIGLREQRLLGERAERTEEADPPGVGRRSGYGRLDARRCHAGRSRPWQHECRGRSRPAAVARRRACRRALTPDDAVGDAAAAAVRRGRRRAGRPSPCAAPGHARSGVRAGQDPRAVRRASSASCSPTAPGRCCSPGPTTTRPRAVAGRPPARDAQAGTVAAVAPPDAVRAPRDVLVVTRRHRRPAGRRRVRCSRSRAYGFDADRLADVGVAGLHRLLAHLDELAAADAVVVVAGMEGALASVVGGLTARARRRRADQRRLRRGARRRDRAAGDARRRAPAA